MLVKGILLTRFQTEPCDDISRIECCSFRDQARSIRAVGKPSIYGKIRGVSDLTAPINVAASPRWAVTATLREIEQLKPIACAPTHGVRPCMGATSQNNPGIALLIDAQRPSRLVVHTFFSCHVEIIRFLKRPDRIPCLCSHHTINWPGIDTLILQSLLYLFYSIRIWSSGMGCGSGSCTVLNSIRHLLAPSRRYREAGSCQQCRYNGYR